ncbi:transcriptional repressor [Terrabacter lapilli]|uniref:Transcriptional repressor n=1 Tax=Terrabacter lapilli TaxID=436231 RepID=A0ABN2S7K2_9MICO|nr:transcriptional repressor [Terrabacter sp.]
MATSADHPTDSARVTGAVSRLRSAGERVTAARYAVLRVVDAADRADEHLTAEQIGARVAEAEPAVHRATVYRTLTSLVETGVLSHVHLGGTATIYHLTEPASLEEDPQPHDHQHEHAHVQCHECGRVLDVPPELFDDVRERLRAELDFELDTGHAALLGTCRDCRPT